MYKEIKFVAFDGTKFDDEEECIVYEAEKKLKPFTDTKQLQFFDEDKNPLSVTDEYFNDKIVYLVATTYEAASMFEEVSNIIDLSTPFDRYGRYKISMGSWCYDNGWVSYEDMRKKFIDVWENIPIVSKK